MPTYEYKCAACGYAFEKFHSILAAPIKLCPQCKKRKVKRLIGTGAALIFKGSGFYITDYRSDGYKSAAKNDSASGSSGSSDGAAAGGEKSASTPGATTPAATPAAPAATPTPASKSAPVSTKK